MEIQDKLFVIWIIGFTFVVIAAYLSDPGSAKKFNDKPIMVMGLLVYAMLWFVFVPLEIYKVVRERLEAGKP